MVNAGVEPGVEASPPPFTMVVPDEPMIVVTVPLMMLVTSCDTESTVDPLETTGCDMTIVRGTTQVHAHCVEYTSYHWLEDAYISCHVM